MPKILARASISLIWTATSLFASTEALGGYAFTLSSSPTDPLATVASTPDSTEFRQVYLWAHSYDPAPSDDGLSAFAARLVTTGLMVINVSPDSGVIAIGSDIQFGISACDDPYPRRLATIAILDSAGTIGLAPLSGQTEITSADCDADIRLPYVFGYSSSGALPPHYSPPSLHWSTAFSNPQFGGLGLNSAARALAVQNSRLYAGGSFTQAGPVTVNALASYTELGGWSDVGGGVTTTSGAPGVVRELLAFGSDDLAVAGTFENAGTVAARNVARRVGATSWAAYGPGLNTTVHTLARHQIGGAGDPLLFAGGDFQRRGDETTGPLTLHFCAFWNGSSWNRLFHNGEEGDFGVNASVLAMLSWNGKLVVGGGFTAAGGQPANRIATWEVVSSGDSSWAALGAGFNGTVHALAEFQGNLYAAGEFTKTGDNVTTLNGVARWNAATSEWLPVGGGLVGTIAAHSLLPLTPTLHPVDTDYLLVGGSFGGVRQNTPSDLIFTTALSIARWRPATASQPALWTPLEGGVQQAEVDPTVDGVAYVEALASFSNRIYLAGQVRFVGNSDLESYGIAAWLPDVDALAVPEGGAAPMRDNSGILLALSGANPTTAAATCIVELTKPQYVVVAVFDVAGRRVRQLLAGHLAAGVHPISWDRRDDDGTQVTSGTYFLRLLGVDGRATHRVTLLR